MRTLLIASHGDAFSSLVRNSLTAAGFMVVVVDNLSIISSLARFGCIHIAIIDSTFGDDEFVPLLLRLRTDRTRVAILRVPDLEVEPSRLISQCITISTLRRKRDGVDLRVLRADQSSAVAETQSSFEPAFDGRI